MFFILANLIPDSEIMNTTMDVVMSEFASGGAKLQSAATGIMSVMIAIEIAWAGSMLVFGSGEDVFRQLLRKFVHVGIFAFIVLNLSNLMTVIMDGFVWAGQQVGSGVGVANLTQPTAIIDLGLNATAGAWSKLFAVTILDAEFFPTLVMVGVSMIVLIAYFVIAMQVFMVVIEFYVVAAFGALFIPFGVNSHTKWITERYFGAVLSSGVKLMVTIAVMGMVSPILTRLSMGDDPTFYGALSLACGVATVAVLVVKTGSVAAGLMNGAASLDGSDLTSVATTSAGAVAGVGSTAAMGGAGVAKAAGGLGMYAAGTVASKRS